MKQLCLLLTAAGGDFLSKYIPGNQKHLTLEDRIYIENSLNKGCAFKDIAKYLCKDLTAISAVIFLKSLPDTFVIKTI